MSFSYSKIRTAHIELSSYCNASCRFCTRNYLGGPTRKDLKLAQISIADFKQWFPVDFVEKIQYWIFCGTVGDPGTASDLIEIVSHIREINPTSYIFINTNAGMREPDFWFKLGKLFQQGRYFGQVVFSIDGLEDTNHIYRRNVVWSKVMEHARAFIRAKGRAHWDFLIFRHNEHQVSDARKLALEMGFEYFRPKKALGFQNMKGSLGRAVYNKSGEFEYFIYPPTDPNDGIMPPESEVKIEMPLKINFAKMEAEYDAAYANYSNYEVNENELKYLENLEEKNISCKSLITHSGRTNATIYVSSDGTVFPCCYTGSGFLTREKNYAYLQLKKKISEFGLEKINLHHLGLKEILDSDYLSSVFTQSWDLKKVKSGRMAYCAETCGTENAIDKVWTHAENHRDRYRVGLPIKSQTQET